MTGIWRAVFDSVRTHYLIYFRYLQGSFLSLKTGSVVSTVGDGMLHKLYMCRCVKDSFRLSGDKPVKAE